MKKEDYIKFAKLYKEALLQDVIPFWEKHSLDHSHGGYFSCLDRQGTVYDTDKFIWLQGRQTWIFSMLRNKLKFDDSWLATAKLGADFLLNHGRSKSGEFYFSTTATGVPLTKPYSIFSDCFAAMALSQYARASQNEGIMNIAHEVYKNIETRRINPKGVYNKRTHERPLKDFALPMILSNLVLEMEDSLEPGEVDQTLDFCVSEVMGTFLDEDKNLLYEYVSPEGNLVDCFEGRLLNPGHGLEAMWFMLDIGARRNDFDLIAKATQVILSILEYSWDQEFGGVYYFMDAKGYPPQQLEWDQKLWWVHLEALVALTKAYCLTQNKSIEHWYHRVHQYTWTHFPDREYGEWFGYLNRQGHPHLTLKGGKWKGCFHVPRGLFQCWQSFEKLSKQV